MTVRLRIPVNITGKNLKKRHSYFTQRRRWRLVTSMRRLPFAERKAAFRAHRRARIRAKVFAKIFEDTYGEVIKFPLNRGGGIVTIYNNRKLERIGGNHELPKV